MSDERPNFLTIPVSQPLKPEEYVDLINNGYICIPHQSVLNTRIIVRPGEEALPAQNCNIWYRPVPVIPQTVILQLFLLGEEQGADAATLDWFCQNLFGTEWAILRANLLGPQGIAEEDVGDEEEEEITVQIPGKKRYSPQ